MTISILAFILVMAVIALVASPLFRGRANQSLGRGKENDSPIRQWQEEKDRLTGQLRDNDLALAEGRVDVEVHDLVALRLSGEAEHALTRLRQAREGLTPASETIRPIHIWRAAFGAMLVVAMAYGAHLFASLSDIDMTRRAHAGQMQAGENGTTPDTDMPVADDGVPDIGAMVARLEARIEGGDYSPEDIAMLLRSYQVLERPAEAQALLVRAIKTFPQDERIRLTFIDAALSGADPAMLAQAQAMLRDLLTASPDLPEARWYHSLFLVRQGDIDGARQQLRLLAPLVAGNKEAAEAVAGLLARLDIPAHDQFQPR